MTRNDEVHRLGLALHGDKCPAGPRGLRAGGAAMQALGVQHGPELRADGHYSGSADSGRAIQELHADIGELTMERAFLANSLGRLPAACAKR